MITHFFFALLYTIMAYRTGFADKVEYVQLKEGYKVWTQRVGYGPIKILALHGGPGCTHEYLTCLSEHLPKDQYQIIYYDQLGSYYSDQPDDVSLWTVERFREEIEQVREALGLEDFYLYGQSCGGIFAIEYALKYSSHLKGLILSNITGSYASYGDYLNHLRLQLPASIQEKLAFYESQGDFYNPEYEKVMFEEVYSRHLCRQMPWPDALQQTFAHLNPQVYRTLHGPNEFVITGPLKDWDRWNDLSQIPVPTLLIGARYDTMDPADQERMAALIPHSRVKICENGSHCSHHDDPENYFPALCGFINDVENAIKS